LRLLGKDSLSPTPWPDFFRDAYPAPRFLYTSMPPRPSGERIGKEGKEGHIPFFLTTTRCAANLLPGRGLPEPSYGIPHQRGKPSQTVMNLRDPFRERIEPWSTSKISLAMQEPCLYPVNAPYLHIPTVACPERLDVTFRRSAATVSRKRNGRKLSSNLMCSEAKTMEKEIIFLVEEAPEGGYEARALGHSIFTEADTFEELNGARCCPLPFRGNRETILDSAALRQRRGHRGMKLPRDIQSGNHL